MDANTIIALVLLFFFFNHLFDRCKRFLKKQKLEREQKIAKTTIKVIEEDIAKIEEELENSECDLNKSIKLKALDDKRDEFYSKENEGITHTKVKIYGVPDFGGVGPHKRIIFRSTQAEADKISEEYVELRPFPKGTIKSIQDKIELLSDSKSDKLESLTKAQKNYRKAKKNYRKCN
jgi:Skp family chaperone for outer membrane proteins